MQRPPEVLYIQGAKHAFDLLERLPKDGLAVVGTRRPQARSIELTKSVIHELADSHLIIVSGLAFGIDAAAHQAALRQTSPRLPY